MDQKPSIKYRPDNLIAPELRSLLEPFKNGHTILNEAEFGYRHIQKYVKSCGPGGRVLEVGSGPCVLLSQLKIDFPGLDVTGIEPIGPGFDHFDPTLRRLTEKYGFKLQKTGYEDFADPGQFDLIFLVNVFEHLPDWRHFLDFVAESLKPAGRCVILCPNYGFPYESHFRLPVIFNKRLTHMILRRSIETYEAENGCHGLWKSLNFVKWSAVRKAGARLHLDLTYDASILREMIERLGYDEEFARRQRNMTILARLVLGSGIVRLLETSALKRFNPYMLLVIRKFAGSGCRTHPRQSEWAS